MKLPKYNLAYNTQDQLQLLAVNASERKHEFDFVMCLLIVFQVITLTL